MRVVGHTSRTGSAAANERLSRQRAEVVQKMLEQDNRTLASKLSAAGVGSKEALVGLGTDDCATRSIAGWSSGSSTASDVEERSAPRRGAAVIREASQASGRGSERCSRGAGRFGGGRLFGSWRPGRCSVSAAQANTYADTCTGCHATNATSPPFMPSQDATFGKIMKDTGQFTDECLVTTNCVLRQRLKGEDALGNIIDVNARNNMDSLGEGVGSFTNAELEAVRLYLLKVRDLVIANPSPAFSFPSTLTTGNNSIASTVAIQNWRGTSVSYAFTLVGTNPGDYSITAGASGSCAATSSLAAPNNCNANVTVRFSPTAGGSVRQRCA